jgi:EmrB/QacA subfamily drug resistance transporter
MIRSDRGEEQSMGEATAGAAPKRAAGKATARATAPKRTAGQYRWLAFSAALAAAMMDLLDTTIVSTAAPAIRVDLGGSFADVQWMAAGYTLAMAVMLLVGGRLGDLFGRKRMLLYGVVGFTAASVAAGFAPSAGALIAARVVQGGVGAVMVPQVFGLIRDLFPPQEMGKAWGVFGPVAGLSAMLGPIVAGGLIDADLLGSGWRMIFLINVPVAAYVLIVGGRLLPGQSEKPATRRLDGVGAALVTAGSFLLVYPIVQGRELGWPAWTFAMIAGAVVVLGVFALHQGRRRRTSAVPLIETSLLRNRSYVSGVAFALVFLGAMAGISLTLSVALQAGLGYSPIHAGLTTAAFAVGGFVGSGVAAGAMQKLGRTVLHAGLIVMAGGLVGLALVFHEAGTGIASWHFVGPLFVSGIGMGAVFMPLFDIVVGGLEDHQVGSASGLLQALQQLGAAMGVAVIGTVFFGALGSHAGHERDFLHAAELTTLIAVGLLAVAFAIGFLMPKQARESVGSPTEPALA